MRFPLDPARRRPPALSVALIGPDGAGKTTITRRVAERLPVPSRTIYMGVNLEASTLVLPTTRMILLAKRARGRRPDLTVSGAEARQGARRPIAKRMARSAKATVRMANWMAEEWFRQGVAAYARRRGEVVIFDRHFFCDYYAYDVVPTHGRRPLSARVHGLVLARVYPRPDLVIYLDAPAAVLHARKQEGTLEFLERRRQDYLALADVFERFVVVDAARASECVASDVLEIILHHLSADDGTSMPPAPSTEARAPA